MDEQDPEIGPTHRYGEPEPFEMAFGDSENIEAIGQHIERWVGKPATVYHELVSDKVHIDVHIVEPTAERPFYTLITSGMSDRPMKAPESRPDWAYAELFLCLPSDWKMSSEDWKSQQHFWPVQALKYLARLPHQYNTWLWYGHTIPNGDPPQPIDDSTTFSSFILLCPHLLPKEFHELAIGEEKTIRFFAVVPLYTDELGLKLKHGAEAVEHALIAQGYSELIDIRRSTVAWKPGFFSRLFKRT